MAKAKILLMPDFPGWAFDIRAQILKKYLSHKYQFKIVYSAEQKLTLKQANQFAITYLFYWPHLVKFPLAQSTTKLILGLHSHRSWQNQFWRAVKLFRQADTVLISTKTLADKFKTYTKNIVYLPHAADHYQFKIKRINRPQGNLVVGWAGNPDYNQGKEKGYYDIILPAIKKLDNQVILKTALSNQQKISHHKMVDFYNSINVYLNASKTEGGPLPCFEAAACGRPIITTPCGSMPEFINNGYNGFLVKRSVSAFHQTIKKFLDQPELATNLGRNARREIEQRWNWQKRVKDYDKLFQGLLNKKEC